MYSNSKLTNTSLLIDAQTLCQLDRLRAVGWSGVVDMFMPECQDDGSFAPAQCDRSSAQCWCVDKNGNELVGTRTANQPSCTSRGSYNVSLSRLSIRFTKILVDYFLFV